MRGKFRTTPTCCLESFRRCLPKLPTGYWLNRSFWLKLRIVFMNMLIWGCILLHHSDLASPNFVSFGNFSHILPSHCENFWGNCEFVIGYWLYCDWYDFTDEIAHFPIYCLSRLDYFSRVYILFVTTKFILKCFRILLNRLKFYTTLFECQNISNWFSDLNGGAVSLSETESFWFHWWLVSSEFWFISEIRTFFGIDNVVLPLFSGVSITSNELH